MSDYFESFLTPLPTVSDDLYPVMSYFWGHFRPPTYPKIEHHLCMSIWFMSVLFCKYSNFFLEYRVHSLCLLKLFSSFVFIQIFGFVLETRLIADWSLLKCWFWESRWYFPSIFPFKFISHSRHWIECTNAKNLKLFLDYSSFEQYSNSRRNLHY